MLIIGLTGGIGSGKSMAAKYFAERGAPVIDADIVARELVIPGSPALRDIVQTFGKEVLLPNGELNRAALRNRVFHDPEQRRLLEDVLHPRIRQEMLSRARHITAPYCIMVVPLLVESGWQDMMDRVLVIDVPETLQITRVRARDHLTEDEVFALLRIQAGRETRLAAADDVIVNDAGPAEIDRRVGELHAKYLSLAKQGNRGQGTGDKIM
jgi:dephospho-CoA kinase